MKYIYRILAVVLFLACPGMASGTTYPVDSAVTRVTIFTSQAMVTRTATVEVEEGAARLVLTTDAADIAHDSVTATVYGDGEILGVQLVRAPLAERPREIVRELETRLDELKNEKQARLDAREALSRQETFLEGIIDFSGDQLTTEMKSLMPSTEYLQSYLSFFDRTFNELFERRRAIDIALAELERQIDHVMREIDRYREGDGMTRTGIEILFRSDRDQPVGVEARYRVARAQWTPLYRASVGDDMKEVNLAMIAEIVQGTGEDWNDVELTVSNAVPVRSGRLPELEPWWLDYSEPVLTRQRDGVMKSALMEQAPSLTAEAPPAEALRRERALSFEYTIPMPVTIPSRQQETRVSLLTRVLEGTFYHYATPILTTDVYLVCQAEADRELLPGPVNIFFDNSYAGRVMLGERGAGESFTLPLGIDRSVKVKREKLMDRMEETSFFGRVERKTIKRELTYRMSLESLRESPVIVHLRDHVPISRTDRISVEDITFSKPPDLRDVDGKAGVMQWNLELDPGETLQIDTRFTVSYPREMEHPWF